MKKKIYLLIYIFLGLFLITIIYEINESKFTSEYWLQNRIDKLTSKPIKFCKPGLKRIKYRINDNDKINFEIEINDLGSLIIKKNSWYDDSKDIETYYFTFEPNKFIELEKQFKTQFPKSKTENIDEHLSSKFYEIYFTDTSEINKEIEVAYYNVKPDEKFIDFKNELLVLTKETINKATNSFIK